MAPDPQFVLLQRKMSQQWDMSCKGDTFSVTCCAVAAVTHGLAWFTSSAAWTRSYTTTERLVWSEIKKGL